MHGFRNWILALGMTIITPSVTMADGFLSSLFQSKSEKKTQATAEKSANQRTAEDIAAALRSAKLTGYDIQIEFKNGVAKLTGRVQDEQQRARATLLCQRVRDVKTVDNKMTVISRPQPKAAFPVAAKKPATPIVPAQAIQDTAKTPQIQQSSATVPAAAKPAAKPSNQRVAESIAAALSSAGLNGYDIEVRYQDGLAMLSGTVSHPTQRAIATQTVSQVPGVRKVENRLASLRPAAAAGQPGAYQPGAYQPGAYPPVTPVAYQAPPQGPGAYQAPPQGPGAGVGLPASYGHPGAGASQTVHNMPNLPNHAWPAYASYPNYSQVTYPKQYSASAWPYIGPFYPYPQIPLGWRQVQLEWDDGYWSLNFNPRTEKWWWFVNPKNW